MFTDPGCWCSRTRVSAGSAAEPGTPSSSRGAAGSICSRDSKPVCDQCRTIKVRQKVGHFSITDVGLQHGVIFKGRTSQKQHKSQTNKKNLYSIMGVGVASHLSLLNHTLFETKTSLKSSTYFQTL